MDMPEGQAGGPTAKMYLWDQAEDGSLGTPLSLEEQILNSTFEACDPQRTGTVAVTHLLAYLEAVTGRGPQDARLQTLACSLDPNGEGPQATVDLDTFLVVMRDWITACQLDGPATADLLSSLEDLELSNRRLAGENAKLQRSMETAEEGSARLGEEISALRKQLRSTQQALQFARGVDEELEDLKTLAKSLEEQNRSLLAQARYTEKEQQRLVAEMETLQEENEKLLAERDGVKRRSEELASEKDILKRQLYECERLICQRDAVLSEKQEETAVNLSSPLCGVWPWEEVVSETDEEDELPPETPVEEQIPKLSFPEISLAETPETRSSNPTKIFDLKSLETHDPDTPNSKFLQTLHPDPTETPHPASHVGHKPNPTEIPQTKFPTTLYQDSTEIPTASDPEISTSLAPETPAPFKEVTALSEQSLNPKSEALAATQPTALKLPASDSPGTVDLKAPQNSSPKGPDAPPPSARIAGPPAPPGPTNQPAPATPRAPQRRSRGERVNTIIVLERVQETGVTVVGRPRGAAGGALCLFLAGIGLLIGIFLLLWCLYRRAARHRPFGHHRLPNDGDEPVMHLDAPKEPYDLYFYAPDAWVPSHIATKQPPPTPPLPPKLPPPPRGGRPQRLEPLSPATLPNNFL
ncbi:hypothetical protein G4228_002735 [Cervus hanglu yarkandensis]|nr:hypothetical protein G4228_002735 [Cervus hanglu yarkandensis]